MRGQSCSYDVRARCAVFVENLHTFGVTPVVAINAFLTAHEVAAVKRIAEEARAYGVALAEN